MSTQHKVEEKWLASTLHLFSAHYAVLDNTKSISAINLAIIQNTKDLIATPTINW